MGRFAGLGSIRTNQGGVYFLPGNYVVDLVEVKSILSRKKKDCFIIGAKIVESDTAERKPGTVCSQVVTINPEYLETCLANIKQFAGAVLGIEDPDEYLAEVNPSIPGDTPEEATDRFWDDALESLVSDEQPAAGLRMCLNCVNIKTKNGGDFTKHYWSPYYDKTAV